MLYNSRGFSDNGEAAMLTKDGEYIYDNMELSYIDINEIRLLYGCNFF